MIDYRDLLIRYIAHVACEEGMTFIDVIDQSAVTFSSEQIEELRKLDELSEAEELLKEEYDR